MFRLIKEKRALRFLLISTLLVLACAGAALAQTTSFTYQGRLMDGGTPANGTYEIRFTLWDAAAGGTQQPQPAPVATPSAAVPQPMTMPYPRSATILRMKKYVGTAKTRPDSRTPRRFPKAMMITNATEIGTM